MATTKPELSFTAAEAYKLLRTNILFSFTEEKNCYVIGITSAMRGEGKSTTAMNLSYAFAEAGKKTLIIDTDLRLPKLARKFSINRAPGLSNVLTGVDKQLSVSKIEQNLYVLPSGNIPPNPSELLASQKMTKILDSLKEDFDIIILDLPPVTIVSDALVISPLVDGMVVVVREDYADKRALSAALEQLEFAGAKIIGFVTTLSTEQINKYGYRKYGKKKYGYKYDYKYKKYGNNYAYDQTAYETQYSLHKEDK